ncbi:bromodomain-containing protein DDB_G0280777-like [Teleopsis dalmanni]|uniref:bromodomain-containing protein DDB_G0280777-like n=1 Tax=Teleopsis dalmanni TaxID=139649 RepID=UPI0018CEB5E6|nr:bromodomain-containing protein DDB_G0280777-like [Teleopsis dalmanni]
MSTTYKLNGYNQSVKSSILAPKPTAATSIATAIKAQEMSTPMQPRWRTGFIHARPTRVASATSLAANRLHSTRSMSAALRQQRLQQQQQRRRLLAKQNSRQQRQQRELFQQQQQEQQKYLQQLQLQQNHAKSFNNLDPLLRRQLQMLLEQKAQTMRHSQMSSQQHLQQQQQRQQQQRQRQLLLQPQELQLAHVANNAAPDLATKFDALRENVADVDFDEGDGEADFDRYKDGDGDGDVDFDVTDDFYFGI